MIIRRTNQGGSVATFVVIGIILVSSLIGVVYFVNQRAEQARKEQSIAAEEKEKATKEPVKSSEPEKTTTEESNSGQVSVGEPEESSASNELPVTGPGLTAGELVGVYLLTSGMVAYMLSRRKLALSL